MPGQAATNPSDSSVATRRDRDGAPPMNSFEEGPDDGIAIDRTG